MDHGREGTLLKLAVGPLTHRLTLHLHSTALARRSHGRAHDPRETPCVGLEAGKGATLCSVRVSLSSRFKYELGCEAICSLLCTFWYSWMTGLKVYSCCSSCSCRILSASCTACLRRMSPSDSSSTVRPRRPLDAALIFGA